MANFVDIKSLSFIDLIRSQLFHCSIDSHLTATIYFFCFAGERARTRSPDMRKSNRTAWGRVKDIIHTRKDSLKVKNKRSNSAGDMLPDAAGFEDYSLCYDSPNSSASQVGCFRKLFTNGAISL